MNQPTLLEDQVFNELNFGKKGEVFGPSSRSVCKVLNGNACGSGGIVGKQNGKTLVLTNAHVAGTKEGHIVTCTFPFMNNFRVNAKVILGAYSDQIMMDWAVLEIAQDIALPAVKLSIKPPGENLYSNGYPKCDGPWPVKLRTVGYTHGGTVWRGQPNAIGGQSGSPIHDVADNFQRVLLTWSWGGDCAGQTTKAIWFQYHNKVMFGAPWPKDEEFLELGNRAEHLENGFFGFSEVGIDDLPIWEHLDTPTPPPTPLPPEDKEFRAAVLKHAEALVALAKSASIPESGGGTFGL